MKEAYGIMAALLVVIAGMVFDINVSVTCRDILLGHYACLFVGK